MKYLRLIAATIFLGLGGCASILIEADPNQRYCARRGGFDPQFGGEFDPQSITRTPSAAAIKLVQLTDEGAFVDRCQISDLLFDYRSSPNRPKLLVMFVHGWKHGSIPNLRLGNLAPPGSTSLPDRKDASSSALVPYVARNFGDDSDLSQFESFVAELAAREASTKNPRDVLGVYITWPGKELALPLANELTFWSRKRAADRIAQSGTLTQIVASIKATKDNIRKNPNDALFLIGHSFGARILYSATSQQLIGEIASRHPGYRYGTYERIHGPADLVVLLNPALEASTYRTLDAHRRMEERVAPNQPPLVLTVSTTGDWATRLAFPIGQFMAFESKQLQITTLGNHSGYFTHMLGRVPSTDDDFKTVSVDQSWFDRYCDLELCLVRTDSLQPGNPFLVATTDDSVLEGHNGIWSKRFKQWLSGFLSKTAHCRLNGCQ